MNEFTIAGSARTEPDQATKVGKTHGNTVETVALSVPTKSRRLYRFFVNRHAQIKNGNPVAPISSRAFARRFGANRQQMEAVAAHVTACGIEVVGMTPHSGEILIRGRLTSLKKFAQFELNDYRDDATGRPFRARVGDIKIVDPRLIQIGVTSFRGLDGRKVAHSHVQVNRQASAAASGSWTVPDLAKRFNIPLALLESAASAKYPVKIGIVELGGGYRKADNVAAAKRQGGVLPVVQDVLVDGAKNSPTDLQGADGEVDLDVQTEFPIGSHGSVLVGFAPNGALGFPHVIKALVDAGADIISISWGGPMLAAWSGQDILAMERELARADALGIVVLVASGDRGSTDGTDANDVDYPSASAHCTAAGGLFVGHDGTLRVWNDDPTNSASGGGVASTPVPLFQEMLQKLGQLPKNVDTGKAGRCVPDASGPADPNSGVVILVDGQWMVIGGTSFAAPFIALGLAVIIGLTGKRLTGFNTYLYTYGVEDGFVIDILPPGDNDAYKVLKGYDCATGVGAIDFTKLLASLQKRGFVQSQLDLAA